jgi:hypothetical protein
VDEEVADAVEVSQPSLCRVRKHYFEEGLEAALNRRPPNREYHRKLNGERTAGVTGTLGPSDLGRPVVPPLPCVRATDISSCPPCRVVPAGGYARASAALSVWRRIRFG